ncbi:MAG TPA: 6,7-dimethyl-8-ribityllumazine synthase [Kiritimatiellia bacterium]|nr:6,7-dimethyl-8-ribityllumazine synthase [Kiritimatiellia bacterium]HRZ12910.1 6,7-dimethyl-8-ribityllumazine synthase [Kiritimatiellia bacterium]HSA18480.1 6,7-dimethyl-8-ribityllumazine synthase [Kiritimatiellia bacterium]
MSTKEYAGQLNAAGLKFGIVVSRFNDFLTRQLLAGAVDCLSRHGAAEADIAVAWVPGAYEIPLAAQKLAQGKKYSAVVALGAVIQGATPHAELINTQLARALMQIALESGVPVIDGVVAAENLDQAIERCGTKSGNRGWNAAQSAIEMANLLGNWK